jgi:LCP family protein required for cell wall assembly
VETAGSGESEVQADPTQHAHGEIAADAGADRMLAEADPKLPETDGLLSAPDEPRTELHDSSGELTADELLLLETALRPPVAPPSESRRRPLIAAGLSFVWPGLGQIVLGRPKAAIFFALPALLFSIVVAYEVGGDPVFFAASLWDETYLAVVIVAIAAFGGWRIFSVLHALAGGGYRRHWRRLESGVAIALVVAIVGMHGAVAAVAWDWYQTSVSIQGNDFFADASATTAAPTPTPSPRAQVTFSSSGPAAPSNPYPASSPTQPPNPNRITFLLIGIDFMAGRTHALTDTLMVVSVDTQTRAATIISVPRDTAAFQMYYGPWVGTIFKINSIVSYVGTGALKSPDTPIKTLQNEISFLLGIPIGYYAAIDMDGFAKMVDAIGGVDVYNPRAINDTETGIVMSRGPHHLDGATAVLYARSREMGGSDYIRSDRQQGLLVALEHKVLSAGAVSKLGTLLNLASKSIATDFPLKTARNYVKLGQTLTSVQTCVLSPPYSWHPDSSTTRGTWTSRLDLSLVANLSVYYFGQESRYYGQIGVKPTPCQT